MEFLASHTTAKGVTIWCIGTIVNTINKNCTDRLTNKIFLVPCQSIFNMVFTHIFFLFPVSFSRGGGGGGGKGANKERRNKKGKKEKKKVKSRDKINKFLLWRPVPQGRGVAKSNPDHDQGFIPITSLVFLHDMPKGRGVARWDPAHVASRVIMSVHAMF